MYVLVKLNSNQGADLGPNFTLTANVGTLVPATATLAELLVGVTVLADNTATQVFVTSQGICTNTLNIAISPATTTTTSTTSTTTTTTNTNCLLSGGSVVKSPYVLWPERFVFSNNGPNDICFYPTVPAYGPPCDPLLNPYDPFCIFTPPTFLFQDPYGTIPFPYSKVLDRVFASGGANSVYQYNSTTGAVGGYFGSCLG